MQKYDSTGLETRLKFKYPDINDSVFLELKTIAGITVNSSMDELEKTKIIIGYAHSLFTHDGDNTPSALDPVTIIKEAKAGKSFRCVEYSLLANALLWAYEIKARVVGLKTKDVETREYGAGHVVIEFWSNKHKKWIMCDVQAGIVPKADDVPLSALELGKELDQNTKIEFVPVSNSRFSARREYDGKKTYMDWIREYLFFYDTPVEITFEDVDLVKQRIAMLVPLDVEPPIMFQGMFKMNAIYTHSVPDFYPGPPETRA